MYWSMAFLGDPLGSLAKDKGMNSVGYHFVAFFETFFISTPAVQSHMQLPRTFKG